MPTEMDQSVNFLIEREVLSNKWAAHIGKLTYNSLDTPGTIKINDLRQVDSHVDTELPLPVFKIPYGSLDATVEGRKFLELDRSETACGLAAWFPSFHRRPERKTYALALYSLSYARTMRGSHFSSPRSGSFVENTKGIEPFRTGAFFFSK